MTPATPDVVCPATVGSDAFADTVTLPEIVELFAGVVMETVGGVVSGDWVVGRILASGVVSIRLAVC